MYKIVNDGPMTEEEIHYKYPKCYAAVYGINGSLCEGGTGIVYAVGPRDDVVDALDMFDLEHPNDVVILIPTSPVNEWGVPYFTDDMEELYGKLKFKSIIRRVLSILCIDLGFC